MEVTLSIQRVWIWLGAAAVDSRSVAMSTAVEAKRHSDVAGGTDRVPEVTHA